MNAKTVPFVLLWALTLFVAYLVGSKTTDPQINGKSASQPPSRLSERQDGNPSLRSSATAERASSSPAVRLARDLSPAEAVAELAWLSDPLERSRGFLALIDRLGPEEFLEVVAEFRALGITDNRIPEYKLLLSAWAQADPLAALEYSQENTGGRLAQETVLATWSRNDLPAALAWAEANHEGEEANPWMVGIITGIADTDPIRASQLMETLPYSRERGRALGLVADPLLKNDPSLARDWAVDFEDGRLRSGAIAYVANALSRSEPADAAAWLSSVGDLGAQERAAEDVGERLANHDAEQAKTWAASLKPSVLDKAAEGIVDQLVKTDPLQAAEWLSEIGQGDVNLDGAIRELIRGSTDRDPYLAATWVDGIKSQRDRERYYHRVLGTWMESDATAAREFMNSNEVPDSVRNRFKIK